MADGQILLTTVSTLHCCRLVKSANYSKAREKLWSRSMFSSLKWASKKACTRWRAMWDNPIVHGDTKPLRRTPARSSIVKPAENRFLLPWNFPRWVPSRESTYLHFTFFRPLRRINAIENSPCRTLSERGLECWPWSCGRVSDGLFAEYSTLNVLALSFAPTAIIIIPSGFLFLSILYYCHVVKRRFFFFFCRWFFFVDADLPVLLSVQGACLLEISSNRVDMASMEDPMGKIPPQHQDIVNSTWSQLLNAEGGVQNLAVDLLKRLVSISCFFLVLGKRWELLWCV